MTLTRPLDPSETEWETANAASEEFAALQYLFGEPKRARLYTDAFLHGPTTVAAATERLGTPRTSAAYDYLARLREFGVVTETDGRYDATAVVSAFDGTAVSPVDLAAYGAAAVDDELAAFLDRRSLAALLAAVRATIVHHAGGGTRRSLAGRIGVEAGEAIVVTERLDGVVALLADPDPTIDADELAIDERYTRPYPAAEE